MNVQTEKVKLLTSVQEKKSCNKLFEAAAVLPCQFDGFSF